MTRHRYIDIVKGLSILCIVLLHYEVGVFPKELNIFIGSFMITAFYVTSGWLDAMGSKAISIKEYTRKRFQQLGKPYIYWSVIILMFDLILCLFNYYDAQYLAKEIYKTITLRGIGTLWFLPALFFGGIIWQWLKRKSKLRLFLLFVLTFAYRELYTDYFVGKESDTMRIIDAPFRTLYNISYALIGIAFGYYAFKITKLKTPQRLFFVGVGCLILAYISANYYKLGYIAPLLGPLGLIYIFKSLEKYDIFSFLDYWGQNSLNLMVTHYSITLVLIQIVFENFLGVPFFGWMTLLAFLISLPIQYLFVYMIDRYIPQTLSKSKKE